MEQQIKIWEIIGLFFIIIIGSLFHFLFELSNYNILVAAFAAVNESVWEHLKLAFFPLLIFSLIEYKFIKELTRNFIIAKTVAGYLMSVIIVIIFYAYTAILGDNLLIFDVLTFIIAVFIGQIISYKILILPEKSKNSIIISWIAIIMLVIIFVVFTYYPPELQLFQDSINEQYGII
jgi:hypothetical protein